MSLFAFILAAALPACTAEQKAQAVPYRSTGPDAPVARVESEYPSKEFFIGITGLTRIAVAVAEDGSSQPVCVLTADPPGAFEGAAVKALSQWRWPPGGKARLVSVPFSFQLDGFEQGDGKHVTVLKCEAAEALLKGAVLYWSWLMPAPTKRVIPESPLAIFDQPERGTVIVRLSILPNGKPWVICTSSKDIKSSLEQSFMGAAVSALRLWRWPPSAGPRSRGIFTVTVIFQ